MTTGSVDEEELLRRGAHQVSTQVMGIQGSVSRTMASQNSRLANGYKATTGGHLGRTSWGLTHALSALGSFQFLLHVWGSP